MDIKTLAKSSAFMMTLALVTALITNFAGWFPGDVLTADIRSKMTIFILATMLTVSLSRIPFTNLDPIKHRRSVLRSILLGLVISSIIPLIGYFLLKDTEYDDQAVGLVFIAATPFAASVAPLSFILNGDMEHASRGTIIVYIVALAWIPFIVWITLSKVVDMKDVFITVLELIAVPLILSRLLTKVKINKEFMAIFLNCCIFFLVWLSVGSTNFKGIGAWIFIAFLVIAALRSFGLGNAVEFTEKRMGIHWKQRVSDILMTSYKNKGIAIVLCVALFPPGMVAIATSILVEIMWVAFMDSVLFSKKRMEREIAQESEASA